MRDACIMGWVCRGGGAGASRAGACLRFVAAITLGLGVSVTLLGCASGGGARTGAKGDGYATLYSSGQYQAAYEEASRVAGSLRGTERQRAALIAGLSAQALNRSADAERWLAPLVEDADKGVAGEAGAALGLVALERKEYAKGAKLLLGASDRLSADDAARSAMYAGDCARALGDAKQAEFAYRKGEHYAAGATGDANLKLMIADRIASLASAPQAPSATTLASAKSGPKSPTNGTPARANAAARPAKKAPASHTPDFQKKLPSGLFAVQVGAYSTRQRALSRASDYTRFGPPRVIRTADRLGKNVYAIRLGMFRSEAQAEKFGRWIGRAAEVVSIDDES